MNRIGIISLFMLIMVLFFRCAPSNQKIQEQTELLQIRYSTNLALFDSLLIRTRAYASINEAISKVKIDELFRINDSSSLGIKHRLKSLNIKHINFVYRSNPPAFDLIIYFNDMIDPNLYIRWVEKFDSTHIGRNPLRKILWKERVTNNAWVIQQEYPM